MKPGPPYGTHRVLEPLGVLPQPAWKIDNTMAIFDNEILIDVSALNIDAASSLWRKTWLIEDHKNAPLPYNGFQESAKGEDES